MVYTILIKIKYNPFENDNIPREPISNNKETKI